MKNFKKKIKERKKGEEMREVPLIGTNGRIKWGERVAMR